MSGPNDMKNLQVADAVISAADAVSPPPDETEDEDSGRRFKSVFGRIKGVLFETRAALEFCRDNPGIWLPILFILFTNLAFFCLSNIPMTLFFDIYLIGMIFIYFAAVYVLILLTAFFIFLIVKFFNKHPSFKQTSSVVFHASMICMTWLLISGIIIMMIHIPNWIQSGFYSDIPISFFLILVQYGVLIFLLFKAMYFSFIVLGLSVKQSVISFFIICLFYSQLVLCIIWIPQLIRYII
jgi:hypothetical protein